MISIIIAIITIATLYCYSTRTFNYWKDRGIKHDKPIPLFGNNAKNYFLQKSITQMATDIYWRYPNEKVVGFFRASRPELVIRDPQIAKRILKTDFSYFHLRGLNSHKTEIEPLLRNLVFMDGDEWKLLRQRLTPAFSSGKLKAMFPLISARAERLLISLSKGLTANEEKTMDARDIMARYTTDFIGTVGFGLDTDCLSEDNNAFRKLGTDIFNTTLGQGIIAMLKEIFPVACKRLHLLYTVERRIINLVDNIQKERGYKHSGRNDFMDFLLELKTKGTIVGESIERTKTDGSPEVATLEMDTELMAAQAFVFFAAGFETSSSTSSFTLHQLAFHPEIQKEVQQEIDEVLSRYENELSYEAVKEMKFLEWAFLEGMRIFPSVGYLVRTCAKRYTIPELNVTIDPGVSVNIPLQGLHMDSQYFEEPEVFRPKRFHPDVYDPNKNFVYLPFGDGPRACIGARLGQMQALAGLAAILSKFSVEPAKETLRHPIVDPTSSIVQGITGGLPLVFKKRNLIK